VEDAGYTAVEAVDADEAVAILELRSDIGLIFTDIQMGGRHERWSPIKIILVSGQLKRPSLDLPTDGRFFGKPLDVRIIIAQMQSMIGQLTPVIGRKH
jgi:hypothetical protein